MIVKGHVGQTDRGIIAGKPYVLDVGSDYMRVTIEDRPIAFTDYVPRKSYQQDYLMVDFDKDGRVVGFAVDGILAAYARTSLKALVSIFALRASIGLDSVGIISRALAEVGEDRIFDALPNLDENGRLSAYAY